MRWDYSGKVQRSHQFRQTMEPERPRELGPRLKEDRPHAWASRVPFFVFASAEGARLLEADPKLSPLEVLDLITISWAHLDKASREIYEREAANADQADKAKFEFLVTLTYSPENGDDKFCAKEKDPEPESGRRRICRILRRFFCCRCPSSVSHEKTSKTLIKVFETSPTGNNCRILNKP